ncbi:lytic transglycosylase domain-containing protein [Micromonospora sp. NBC_01813]|uniref:lytic transglycosylase domain-containing protein n=1 Tax=Micromonospora sp. NBC_01813 TaxID=2975988 RepID=UPI002DDAB77B|nr:lytic murein transglycosylase [Micromonospora sp. NBC_01813]WSA06450.1 lytic murein transglycosylase [Micromonospora sp. NBC_01813]
MVEDGEGTPTPYRLRPPVPAPAPAGDATPTAASGGAPTPTGGGAQPADPQEADPQPADPPTAPDKSAPQPAAVAPLQRTTTTAAESADGESEPSTADPKPTAADPKPSTADPKPSTAELKPTASYRRMDAPFASRASWLHPARLRPVGRGARRLGRAVGAWGRRPTGRLVVPGLLLLALIAGSGTAGAVLVPATAGTPAPTATSTIETTAVPELPPAADPELFDPDLPSLGEQDDPLTPAGPARPASALSPWAAQTASRVSIPVVALEAYGYAELVLANTTPGCNLSWTTLAAIGMIESTHGTANGSRLDSDGRANPPIIGLPLDGAGGRQRIADTDDGRLDNDPVLDRAVGPMQFIPTTWAEFGVDADNDGATDPQDIDDAALAAANYLCRNGRNLSNPSDWWSAILSYNNVQPYAQAVFDTANEYGVRSRT